MKVLPAFLRLKVPNLRLAQIRGHETEIPQIHRWNLYRVMELARLKVGAKIWKIMRDLNGVPTEIKQWTLTEIVKQPHGGRLDLHFSDGHGNKEFAYAHHCNDDWFEFRFQAASRAQEIYKSHEKNLNERLASLTSHRNSVLFPVTSKVMWLTTI